MRHEAFAKKSYSPIWKRIVSISATLVFAAIGALFVWKELPASITNPPTKPTTPNNPVIGGTTAPTRETTYYDQWYLPTEEKDWYSTEDTIIWNDCYSFTFTEPPKVSKTIPSGFTDLSYYESDMVNIPETANESGTLTSAHMYLELAIHAEYIKPEHFTLYGQENTSTIGCLAAASQHITVYDRTTKHFVSHTETRASTMLVNGEEMDYHQSADLEVGDIVEFRLVYIIPTALWNNPDIAVLLTPQSFIDNTYKMREIGYTQPHFLLNTAPFAAE